MKSNKDRKTINAKSKQISVNKKTAKRTKEELKIEKNRLKNLRKSLITCLRIQAFGIIN